jgi:hypothetical protein
MQSGGRRGAGQEIYEIPRISRIAKAVEEVRSEIDLQDLIDPERKMNAGDWVKFWEDRGFGGDSVRLRTAVIASTIGPTIERRRELPCWGSRRVVTVLPARQCPGELTYGLLMLLVPDLGEVAGDLELHTLVERDLPRTFFPETIVKIGDRRAQHAGDLK